MPYNNPGAGVSSPIDWMSLYNSLQAKGNVPDASTSVITKNNAIFRGMCLNLSVIKEAVRQSGFTPVVITIYADVLLVPDLTNWLLQSTGLVVFARRVEVSGNATVILDYRETASAELVMFVSEFGGTLTVSAVKTSQEQPVLFRIDQANIASGIFIHNNGTPALQTMKLNQGIPFQLPADMELYLNNAFIFGSLLYDQNPSLALSIFLWVKGWAAQTIQFQELFFRSTSLVTLLNAQINAQANGATFVPYLTASVYQNLAVAFAGDAVKYESDYIQLSTQKTLTEENIALAKTMTVNAQSEIDYVSALLKQANDNYTNANAAVTAVQINFNNQKIEVDKAAANFQQIGLPDYERAVVIKAIFGLVTAVVTFGAAIAAMAVGDEAAAPAAAASAVTEVEAIAEAAETGAAVAKTANSLADTMKDLKKIVEGLKKVYELAKAVKEASENISDAASQIDVIQEMSATADGTDLSAADGWAIYKLQVDDLLVDPIKKEIEYASDYKQALDILVIYGQSLAASQLAVIKAGQEVAAIDFQLYYAREKQANLQKLVDGLQVGEAPLLLMMQHFYQKYLDGKSALFAALKNYQASYFYWALTPSKVQPQIIDPVSDLNAGIQNLTRIAMDNVVVLQQQFDPPPQPMGNVVVEINDPAIIKKLQTTGQAAWVLPLDNAEFAGLSRVRLNDIRIWLEGAKFKNNGNTVFIVINTSGNYLDTFQKINYQFNSKQLIRTFKYMIDGPDQNPDWQFDNGSKGFVQIEGEVDKEVAYAYFQPTPFSEWSLSLLSNNPDLDYSGISKISMYFGGTAIGAASVLKGTLNQKINQHA